jgi:hypothetical protein
MSFGSEFCRRKKGVGEGWEAEDEILMKNCHVTDEVQASPSVI